MSADVVAFDDPVYGRIRFTEPLLVDLYQTQAVQRLRNIHQGGVTAFVKRERGTTRLHHSRGVAALLRILGASVEEQAAGLIHDVAHTAFSHVVDFVYPNRNHDYHEVNRERMVLSSDLPQVLTKHRLEWRYVTESEHYPMLEQPLPALCADRLDYFLRDGVVDVGTLGKAEAQALVANLVVHNGQIVVDDVDAARWLGEQFIQLDDVCWCSVQEVGWYAVMAEALRVALEHGVIEEGDFDRTDHTVMAALREAGDPGIDRWLGFLRRDIDFSRAMDGTYDLCALPKVRAVDPPVLVDGEAVPLSSLDGAFAARRQAYVAGKEGPWRLQIIA